MIDLTSERIDKFEMTLWMLRLPPPDSLYCIGKPGNRTFLKNCVRQFGRNSKSSRDLLNNCKVREFLNVPDAELPWCLEQRRKGEKREISSGVVRTIRTVEMSFPWIKVAVMLRSRKCIHRLAQFVILILCMALAAPTVPGQLQPSPVPEAPKWTTFLSVTEQRVPEEVWDSFYGFNVVGESTIVRDRFLYPVADPPLFTGDRIVSVKSRPVETREQLFKELNSFASAPISIKVERASRLGKPRTLTIHLHRADSELLRQHLGQRIQNHVFARPAKLPLLASNDVYGFGTIPSDMAAEIVGFCDDLKHRDGHPIPVLVGVPVVTGSMSKSEYAARQKLFKEIGDFVILDKRDPKNSFFLQQPYAGDILKSKLRRDVWKVGEHVGLAESLVLVEDPMKLHVDGKERKVSVLTLCNFHHDNVDAMSP